MIIENIIEEYYDKSFISCLLCELSYNYYSFLHQLIIFPTILSSSILTILNSSEIDKDIIKIINIIINGLNTILLTINSNFKLNDRFNHFKNSFTANHHKASTSIMKFNQPVFNTNSLRLFIYKLKVNSIIRPERCHITIR